MEGRKRRKIEISREIALNARPRQVPPKAVKSDGKGELSVTMEYDRPRWQQWLGAGDRCERTYVLDTLGREVYECCDGSRSVADIMKPFAARHKVSIAEAEYSVTTYLKTLIGKGLVVMTVEKDSV